MNNWILYLIRCKQGRLYTGITTDVERRFEEHKSSDKKGSKYLRGKAPLELVMKKKIGSRGMALKIEAIVKKLSKNKKEMLVDGKIKIRDIEKTISFHLDGLKEDGLPVPEPTTIPEYIETD